MKPLQNKHGQKRGNCGFPRKCHELHVLHGSDFTESVDTCKNHVFHLAWITRKRVETVDWCPQKHGKFGKIVYHYLTSFHETAESWENQCTTGTCFNPQKRRKLGKPALYEFAFKQSTKALNVQTTIVM